MERRKFLVGVGGATLGGSTLLGTGAFSRIEAQRGVTIQVAEDPYAYLGLAKCGYPDDTEGYPNSSYAHLDEKGHLRILMNEENPDHDDGLLGAGVNSNSRTWFDRVFQVCNQGKETICLWIEDDEAWPSYNNGERRVEFYLEDDRERTIIGEDNRVVLEVGECVCVGIRTTSHSLSDGDRLLEELDNEITIVADVDCFHEPGCVEQEFHFLSSSRPRENNESNGPELPGTEVFAVDFDEGAQEAGLYLVDTLPDDNFDQVDAMAATPAGDALYVYDKESGHLGRLELDLNGAGGVESIDFEDIGPVNNDPGDVVLATFSQDGILYVASQATDSVYTVVDIDNDPEAVLVGDTGTALQGADMAFDAAGVLHLFSNATNTLYTIDTDDGSATAVCSGIDALTGLAFSDGGTGDLLGSLSGFPGGMDGEIHQFDAGCTVNVEYEMILEEYSTNTDFEGEQYVYTSGDMATGQLCVPVQEPAP